MTKQNNSNAGTELLFLLRRQRYLYHQLKGLAARQSELQQTNSPEVMLELIYGRRKLLEKIEELEEKLRAVRNKWSSVCSRIEHDHKTAAYSLANQTRDIIEQIRTAATPEVLRTLPLDGTVILEEAFAETGAAT